MLTELWIVKYLSNNLSNENIKTVVSREMIFQKIFHFGNLIHVLSWRQQKPKCLCFHCWDYLTNFWHDNWWSRFDVVERLCCCSESWGFLGRPNNLKKTFFKFCGLLHNILTPMLQIVPFTSWFIIFLQEEKRKLIVPKKRGTCVWTCTQGDYAEYWVLVQKVTAKFPWKWKSLLCRVNID